MSLVCCACVERGKTRPDAAQAPTLWGLCIRENLKRKTRKRLSTDAGGVGGPVRSSDEVLAQRGEGGVKGPDCPWFVCLVNRICSGGTS